MKIAYTINADGKTCTITGVNLWGLKDDVFNIPPEINGYQVTSIGEFAFCDCSSLTSVTIPDSVMSIGYRAFSYCTGFTSVIIPDSVKSIGKEAFFGCRGLTSIAIPESVTSIGDYAFAGCGSLESATIPAGAAMNMGNNVFFGCDDLESVVVTDSSVARPTGTGKIFTKKFIPADAPLLKIKIKIKN